MLFSKVNRAFGLLMAGAFLGLLWNSQCKATPAAIVELSDIGNAGKGV